MVFKVPPCCRAAEQSRRCSRSPEPASEWDVVCLAAVEPLHCQTFQPLAIRRQDIVAIEAAPHAAAVLDLSHGVAGQHGRIGQIHLAATDECLERDEGVRDRFLDHVLVVLAPPQVAERVLGVPNDLRDHREENTLPTAAGSGRGGCTDHLRSPTAAPKPGAAFWGVEAVDEAVPRSGENRDFWLRSDPLTV